MAQPQEAPPSVRVMEMFMAPLLAQALHAAAAIGVADVLKDGPRTSEEIAEACGAHVKSLHRVMRALAANGFFEEVSPGRFGLNATAELLRSDVPGSMRGMVIWGGTRARWRPLAEIEHTVRTGETVFEKYYGKGPFEYLAEDRETAAIFNNAMSSFSAALGPAAAEAYDFAQYRTVADIAGGHGFVLSKILKKCPESRGILFDLPQVVAGAPELLKAHGVADRCQVCSGNFFDSVPEGADVYVMKHIIHDWDDDRAIAILKNCRNASKAGGKLLLIEMVVPEDSPGAMTKLLDLEMLLVAGGQERTQAEYAKLYEAAGFRLTRVVPTKSPVFVIEGDAV